MHRVLLVQAKADLTRSGDVDGTGKVAKQKVTDRQKMLPNHCRARSLTKAQVGQARGHEKPSAGIPHLEDTVREHRLRCRHDRAGAGGGGWSMAVVPQPNGRRPSRVSEAGPS